ncbi:TRAP transporter substrate-binding protein [Chloroflexota bacterium]
MFGVKPWGDYIEYVTGGRVKVEFYPDSQLTTWKDALQACESGLIDMTQLWNPVLPGKLPLFEMFSLPGLMSENWAINNCVVRDLKEKYPQFDAQFSDQVVSFHNMVHMPSDVHSIEPIRTLSDLKGKTVATTNEAGAAVLATLGAGAQVTAAGGDIYMGLQRGTFDAAFGAWGWVTAFKFEEVAPYHLMLRLAPGSSSWVMNRETYNKFTPEEQMFLKEYEYRGMFNGARGAIYTAMTAMEAIPRDKIFSLSDEDKAQLKTLFRPAWDEWAEKMEEMGYPGKDIIEDTIRWVEGYSLN